MSIPRAPAASCATARFAARIQSRIFGAEVSGRPGADGGAGPEPTGSVRDRSGMAQGLPFRDRPRFTLRRFRGIAIVFTGDSIACDSLLRSKSPVSMCGSALMPPPPRPRIAAAWFSSAGCPSNLAPARSEGPSCPSTGRCRVRRIPPGSWPTTGRNRQETVTLPPPIWRLCGHPVRAATARGANIAGRLRSLTTAGQKHRIRRTRGTRSDRAAVDICHLSRQPNMSNEGASLFSG